MSEPAGIRTFNLQKGITVALAADWLQGQMGAGRGKF